MFHFLDGCKVSFCVISAFLYLNRKLLPCRKTKQRKFREKIRRFVYSGIVKTCDELDLGSDLDICEAESCSPAVKETYF